MNFIADPFAGFSFEQNLENVLFNELVKYGFEVWNDKTIIKSFGDDVTGIDFYCKYFDFVVVIKCSIRNPCLTDMTNFIYGSSVIRETLTPSLGKINVHKIYASNIPPTGPIHRAATRKGVHIVINTDQKSIIYEIIQKIKDLANENRFLDSEKFIQNEFCQDPYKNSLTGSISMDCS